MKNAKAVSTLSSLITINTKRYDRYQRAADQMKDINRKLLFMNYAVQSQEFIYSLNRWVSAYGHTSQSFSETNVIARTLSGIKNMWTLGGRKFLLNHCEFIERETLKIYKSVLNEAILPSATISDIQKQAQELEEAYLTIKSLREDNVQQLQVA